jgi:hypothetical protein
MKLAGGLASQLVALLDYNETPTAGVIASVGEARSAWIAVDPF